MKLIIHIIKKIFDISNLPTQLKKLTIFGIKLSFILLLFSVLLMALYIDFKPSNSLFIISSVLVQSNSTFIAGFLIFGAFFNRLLKEKNGY